MYTITRNATRAASIAAELRLLPAQKVPLTAAKALTFTAQAAQRAIVAEMPRVFEGGATRYTLGATRIEPATPEQLQARVAVKDQAAGSSTTPENYLLPAAEGGPRREKRFERALRFAGLLTAGMRVVVSKSADVDSFGNIPTTELRRILQQAKGSFGNETPARKGGAQRPYFAVGQGGTIAGGQSARRAGSKPGRLQPGIYRREGKRGIKPVLIFTRKQPRYTPRLPFQQLAEQTARREFPSTFLRLLRKQTQRL